MWRSHQRLGGRRAVLQGSSLVLFTLTFAKRYTYVHDSRSRTRTYMRMRMHTRSTSTTG